MKNAVVSGSFDPITVGHEEIIQRAAKIFGKVYVLVVNNSAKKCMFTASQRKRIIDRVFSADDNIECVVYDGLTAEFAAMKDAVIVKGLRSGNDFEYEYVQSESNFEYNGVETVFMPSRPGRAFLCSTFIRDLINSEKNFERFVPNGAAEIINEILKEHHG